MNLDDPKLTAYALGDLSDPTELHEVESAISKNPQLAKTVEEIRKTAGHIESILEKEPLPELNKDEMSKLYTATQTNNSDHSKVVNYAARFAAWGTGIAACLALFIGYNALDYQFQDILIKEEAFEAPSTVTTTKLKELNVYTDNSPTDDADALNISPPLPAKTVQKMSKKPAPPRPRPIVVHNPKDINLPALETPEVDSNITIKGRGAGGFGVGSGGSRLTRADQKLGQSTHHPSGPSASYAPIPQAAPKSKAETRLRQNLVADSAFNGFTPPLRKQNYGNESYNSLEDNAYKSPTDEALSTFSIDVDTASYANVRRFIENGSLPNKDAVRIEELINYFTYDYKTPSKNAKHPFNVSVETASAPWAPKHRLMKIGIKGFEVPWEERPSANLVFLIDVSGSMNSPNKLPLLKQSLQLLVERFDRRDRVAIVVYAGSSGLCLPSTTADNRDTIMHAINSLKPGGSTNGASGIKLAYELARKHFIKNGNNRIILCTDGDFNVGISEQTQLTSLIEKNAKSGVYLSILGFGMGNYKDGTMEQLSNKGNGNYAYIDKLSEARKTLVDQAGGTLLTIAKDVKIQVEFNPSKVEAYRLIGYANRILAAEDFNNDKKDAGEIGAGHSVTALYEIIPSGSGEYRPSIDPLKYQKTEKSRKAIASDELATVKFRYKQPNEDKSTLITVAANDSGDKFDEASIDFRFAAAVASYGMHLRDSEHKGNIKLKQIIQIAKEAEGSDEGNYRAGFIQLLEQTRNLLKNRN